MAGRLCPHRLAPSFAPSIRSRAEVGLVLDRELQLSRRWAQLWTASQEACGAFEAVAGVLEEATESARAHSFC